MNRPIDDITLYPIEPDPVLAEVVRRKVGKDYRLGVILWQMGVLLALLLDFVIDTPSLRTVVTVGVPAAWFLVCLQNLRSLSNAPVSRVLKAGARSIRDCVRIYSLSDHVIRYRFSGMRQCSVSMDSLAIKMADGRMLDMPGRVFANSYEMQAFAKALAEQKNVPVIDLTDREVAGVS